MATWQRFRMALGLRMTVLPPVLMGGNYLFAWGGAHKIAGVALAVPFATVASGLAVPPQQTCGTKARGNA